MHHLIDPAEGVLRVGQALRDRGLGAEPVGDPVHVRAGVGERVSYCGSSRAGAGEDDTAAVERTHDRNISTGS